MEVRYYPLTNAQRSIWIADNLYPGTSQAVLSATAIIKEEIDFAIMNEAINNIVKENDSLRIRLVKRNNKPSQYFAPFEYREFPVLNFKYHDGEKKYKEWELEVAKKPLELIDKDLFYFAMIKLQQKNICFFKFHHAIIDAWGIVLVIRRTLDEYWHLLNNISRDNTEEAPSYINHIEDEIKYMASERYLKHKEFWTNVFDTVPEFTSLTNNKGFKSLEGRRKTYTLSEHLSVKLNSFCNENGISEFAIFYSILALYLSKITQKKDIAIETPILNRSGYTEKNTVGMFMHNIPTRIYVEPNSDFLQFVTRASKELKKFMKYQRYPHSDILKNFRERHQFSGNIVDVTLNYHNNKLDSVIPYEGIWNYCGAQSNSLSICVSDREDKGIPILDYDYLIEILTEADIDKMHNHICNLLTDALENPNKRLSELQILSKNELMELIVEFNRTDLPYEPKTISELFEEQVVKTPNKTAIVFGDRCLTYSELNEKANLLASYLLNKGITRNSIVGLMVNRSLEMVVGIMGILKAGAAYLPIDPGYPSDRIEYMITHSKTKLILTDREFVYKEEIKNCKFQNMLLSNQEIFKGDNASFLEEISYRLDDLAYVIYTSGSTGNPKGVKVHHRALCNFVNGIVQNICMSNKAIVSLTTISFDIFFLETIFPLTQGMKVIIANEQEQVIPKLLHNIIVKHDVKVIQTTPSRMKLILDSDESQGILNKLSHILIGGEVLPSSVLSRLKELTCAEIFNLYGPTETTIWSTMKNLTHSQKITIGRPIANTQIYILDEYLSPVPIGSIGEIFIAGDGVSLGYLDNKELTEERFLFDPFVPNQKMYRTGDLGRWLVNGEIEYIGRNDNQVKIRGFRIELGEIEACLRKHPSIKEVVVTLKDDKLGKTHLCAYLTGDSELTNENLRLHVSKWLPNYMVPTFFIWLNALPLTPNGKINRKALPELKQEDFIQEETYIKPRNDLEQKLADLWAEALEVEQVGIDDNLFGLGGDSLTILEIISGGLAYEWKLNPQDFYERPTIRKLVAKINGSMGYEDEIEDKLFTLNKEIPKNIVINEVDTGDIFLTGATGFLGIHLLMEILIQTDKKVYCLVRGDQAKEKLNKILEFNFSKLSKAMTQRIIIVNGDFTLKHFGLDYDSYRNLARKLNTVVHCGAMVKHYGKYEEFYRTNVVGTCEVINFCQQFNIKLNHISTISVSGDFLESFNKNVVFSERDIYIGQNYKANVYVRSKFIAEQYVLKAEREGLNATIFRVGTLTGRYQDGKFQRNIGQNAFYLKIRSVVNLGIIPEDFLKQSFEFTPIDYCAKGIVNIIRVNQTRGLIFHLLNHQKLKAIELVSALRIMNYPIRTVMNKEFNSFISEFSKTPKGKQVLSGIAWDLSVNKNLIYNSTLEIDSKFSVDYLNQVGFNWPEIDYTYIIRILNYMNEVGFLPRIKNIESDFI